MSSLILKIISVGLKSINSYCLLHNIVLCVYFPPQVSVKLNISRDNIFKPSNVRNFFLEMRNILKSERKKKGY